MGIHHAIIAIFFEEDINSPIRGLVERQLIKKRLNVLGIVISFFLMLKVLPRKMMCNKKWFLQDFGLLIVKTQLLL